MTYDIASILQKLPPISGADFDRPAELLDGAEYEERMSHRTFSSDLIPLDEERRDTLLAAAIRGLADAELIDLWQLAQAR